MERNGKAAAGATASGQDHLTSAEPRDYGPNHGENQAFNGAASDIVRDGAGKPDMRAGALEHARRGIPVFPVRPEKTPTRKDKSPLTRNGFKDATTNAQQINAWWSRPPSPMIAVPMGQPSRMFCIDLDRKEPDKDGIATWRELVAQHGAPPNTRIVRTPSTGEHWYFRYRDGVRNVPLNKIGPGIEVKGEGGYVVVAPSWNSVGEYVVTNDVEPIEAPEWLIELIIRNQGPASAGNYSNVINSNVINFAPGEFLALIERDAGLGLSNDPRDCTSTDEILTALAVIDPDIGRENWFAIGCVLFKAFGHKEGFRVWDEWSKGSEERGTRSRKYANSRAILTP
jgi:hypothetical protein